MGTLILIIVSLLLLRYVFKNLLIKDEYLNLKDKEEHDGVC